MVGVGGFLICILAFCFVFYWVGCILLEGYVVEEEVILSCLISINVFLF